MDDEYRPFLKIKSERGIESIHYFALRESLPEEFKIIAANELNETEEAKKYGLHKLKAFLEKENLENPGDELLLALLRSCKYNLKKCDAKLKNFVAKRRMIVNMLAQLDMKKIEQITDDMPFGFLPYTDKKGRVILFTRPYTLNLEMYNLIEVGTCMAVFALFLLSYPLVSVSGICYIGENKLMSLFLLYPTFQAGRFIIPVLLSFPVRLARFEIINENYLSRWLFKGLQPFMPDKLKKRVHFHGDGYKNLQKVYDRNILPDFFDGNMGPLNNRIYKERFLNFVRRLRGESCCKS